MKERNINNLTIFEFSSFPNEVLHHGVFSRQGGVSQEPFHSLNMSLSVADAEEDVLVNRGIGYDQYRRTNDTLVHAYLIHGAEVARVSSADYGSYVGPIDGLITNEVGCGLTMNYADCAPIFLYDPIHHAIGLGHAGWQGAVKDLPGAMVRAMVREFDSDPAELLAAVGPCIGPCCYEVGERVIGRVHERFTEPQMLLLPPPEGKVDNGRPYFDLPQANYQNLAEAGVQQIELSGLCTACRTDLFFSHRAEGGKTGRFGTIVILH
ncbi:MAG: peptidoglycan editing factor PgeF [Candidatus Promineifilaceae bacterium]